MTTKCEDCQMINPPDTHTCPEYEERVKSEKTFEKLYEDLESFGRRITELERRVVILANQHQLNKPWEIL